MRRPLLAAAAGVVALGLSIPLVLLGRAVLAAPDRVEVLRIEAPVGGGAQARRSLFDRAADSLLGSDRAGPLFEITREYREAAAEPSAIVSSDMPLRLARLARRVGPAPERSQAHLMAAAVFALAAGNGSMRFERLRDLGRGGLLGEAIGQLRESALLDDRNDAAKYDLELILKERARALPGRATERGTKQTKRPFEQGKHEGHQVSHPQPRRKLHRGSGAGDGRGY